MSRSPLALALLAPGLSNTRRLAVVTTYGSPLWLLFALGKPDRKLIGRGIRSLCARGYTLDWLSLTRMDRRTRAECEVFRNRVATLFSHW